ncbi:MAG: hypothetical protein COA44_12300 [Arcobacter sp.]|nr:MAG: hypothetical protein COA44_12300 [Arcobacter sp.]
MFSTAIWTGILFFTIHKTGQKLGKIEGKINYLHIFLLWLFLMMFSTSFKMLGWTIGNYQDIEKYFYIQVGIIPAWLNLTMWGLILVFGIVAMFLTFAMAKRKEQARKIFILLLPLFYVLNVYEVVKGFYVNGATQEMSIYLILGMSLFVISIPMGSMYYFYNKSNTVKKIFIS